MNKNENQDIICCAPWVAYERRPSGGGWKFVSNVDPEHSVTQQDTDFKANPCPAVQRQVETGDVHQHQEDAWDQETHHIQQGAPTDQHLKECSKNKERNKEKKEN